MFPRPFGLAELTRYQRRWQRLLGNGAPPHPPRPRSRLREIEFFGPNPGNLRMLAYVPPGLPAGAPLVVVLHGCLQNAALYDAGTGWCALAQRRRFAVLFPEQQAANNDRLCFNWFRPEDVARQGGELASIDTMIGWMLARHGLNPGKVFVTGLSAGGAMAAALLSVLPHRFSAGAIIAGVPFGAAQTVGEALHAMFHARRRSAASWAEIARSASGNEARWPRIAIWQGEADKTVVPANAHELEKQWTALHGVEDQPPRLDLADGHARRQWRDAAGRVVVETRLIGGLDHGTPIAARHTGPGGQVAMRFGKPSTYVLDAGVSSTWRIAQFWGLVSQDGQRPLRQPAPATPAKPAKPARRAPRHRTPAAAAPLLFDPGAGLKLAMATLRGMLRPARRRRR